MQDSDQMGKNNHSWVEEFKEFLEGKPEQVPRQLTNKIKEEIHRKLNPSLKRVFFQLALIHGIVSFLTISICPHFGIEIIPGMNGLSAAFMKIGMSFCMMACGIIFMGAGILAAVFLMPPEYVMALKRQKLFHLVILTFLSCGVLISFGEVLAFGWIGLWLLGGLAGSFSSFTLGYRLRYGFQ
jgi:hypothetical protein